MNFFNKNDIEKIIAIGFEAGDLALQRQKNRDFNTSKKSDNSDLTSVDLEISKIIATKLNKAFPTIALVCEEGNLREFEDEIFWLVDPIDGTSGFINGSEEFAVNIALIKNREPVFGLIYAPNFEGGKMAVTNEKNQIIVIEKNKNSHILNSLENKKNQLRIITSKKTTDEYIYKYVKQFYPEFLDNFVAKKMSSATKFFPLIEGKVDLYLTLRTSMEWDIASGHALIKCLSGNLKKITLKENFVEGEEMNYKKKDFTNSFFIASINFK